MQTRGSDFIIDEGENLLGKRETSFRGFVSQNMWLAEVEPGYGTMPRPLVKCIRSQSFLYWAPKGGPGPVAAVEG